MNSKVTNISSIYKLLNKECEIFIQILDKLNNIDSRNHVEVHIVNEAIICGYFNSFYLKNVSESNIDDVLDFFQSRNIYSLYGIREEIEFFVNKYKKDTNLIRNEINYNIMKLNREDFIYPKSLITEAKESYKELVCRPCNINDFDKLKRLQYNYHLEEVYTCKDNYPYNLEMRNFRFLLSTMDNYCLFINSKPISKVNINSKTIDSFQIGGVYTIKDFRKKGFSYICVIEFINYIFNKYKKLSSLQLFVKTKNIPAIRLYNKIGFKKLYESKNIYFNLV